MRNIQTKVPPHPLKIGHTSITIIPKTLSTKKWDTCKTHAKHVNARGGKTQRFLDVRAGKTQQHVGLTLRRLMSYIYMEHPFLMFLDHTQRRSTVGRTPLDE